MKLFEVEVKTMLYVWAEDRREAERVAERHIDDEDFHDSDAREITADSVIDSSWSDCYPYGDAPEGFGNMTLEQIRDEWNNPNPDEEKFTPDPYTLPLPGVGI